MVVNGHPCLVPTQGARHTGPGEGYFIGIAVTFSGVELRYIAQVHWLEYKVLERPWSMSCFAPHPRWSTPLSLQSPPLVTQIVTSHTEDIDWG